MTKGDLRYLLEDIIDELEEQVEAGEHQYGIVLAYLKICLRWLQ